MVIDTSAILAFLRGEPEADAIEALLAESADAAMSAFSVLEARVVLLARFGDHAAAELELLISKAEIKVVPFDHTQAELAFQAYKAYGKGSGHPAQLNLGDCAAYALAKLRREPLLFKGDDFARTDLTPALIE